MTLSSATYGAMVKVGITLGCNPTVLGSRPSRSTRFKNKEFMMKHLTKAWYKKQGTKVTVKVLGAEIPSIRWYHYLILANFWKLFWKTARNGTVTFTKDYIPGPLLEINYQGLK